MVSIKKVIAIMTGLLPLLGCITVSDNPKAEVKSDPIEMSESRIELGLGYLQQGNMPKARENLEKALKHSPDYYRAQISMAHYFDTVGETDRADKLYRTSLRHHPKNGNVLNNYGTFLCKQGEFDQANDYFNRAIKQPYYYLVSASYENAALCALKAGKKNKASYYFQRTLDHDPYRARSILQLSKLEIQNDDLSKARLRLIGFHQHFGVQIASLKLLIELEEKAGNTSLKNKYENLLNQLIVNS
ncbi:type IV pilus biogenesis/stability protein PilW [Vibrio astriarenae]|nr:type IV pilus biogenesis/stability protein PilW [Vibrio astriarenae]